MFLRLVRWLPLLLLLTAFGWVQAQDNEFALSDLDGKTHKLSDYKGKWVIVNYWATWCPPCIEEMPELVFFHENHKDKNAVVLGVNMEDADDQVVRDFLDDHLISYPVVLSEPVRNGPLGRVPALPTTFLVSPEGEVVRRKVGRVTLAELEAWIAPGKGKVNRSATDGSKQVQ